MNFDFLSPRDLEIIKNFMDDCNRGYLERIGMSEEEYRTLGEKYRKESEKYVSILKMHKNKKDELRTYALSNMVTQKKSMGGESIHRGYFCPSPVYDIIVGNCKRGRLCRADNPNASCIYGFDAGDNLIYAKKPHSEEYITYDGNVSLGIVFCNEMIDTVSECVYDENGRIISYVKILPTPDAEGIVTYYKESYAYNNDDTMTVETADLTISGMLSGESLIISLNKYTFTLENGYLIKYVDEIFDTEDMRKYPLEDRTHKVKVKRKIF